MNQRTLLIIILPVLAACLSCGETPPPIYILGATLKKEMARSSAVPDEFSTLAPSSLGYNVWVEGRMTNTGPDNLINVVITFSGTDGSETRTLIAEVKRIKAGETLPFRTRILPTKYDVTLLDEAPEIRFRTE
jgi:hypothetical protein